MALKEFGTIDAKLKAGLKELEAVENVNLARYASGGCYKIRMPTLDMLIVTPSVIIVL